MFPSLCLNGFFQFLQTAVFVVGYISGTNLSARGLAMKIPSPRKYISERPQIQIVIKRNNQNGPNKPLCHTISHNVTKT